MDTGKMETNREGRRDNAVPYVHDLQNNQETGEEKQPKIET